MKPIIVYTKKRLFPVDFTYQAYPFAYFTWSLPLIKMVDFFLFLLTMNLKGNDFQTKKPLNQQNNPNLNGIE